MPSPKSLKTSFASERSSQKEPAFAGSFDFTGPQPSPLHEARGAESRPLCGWRTTGATRTRTSLQWIAWVIIGSRKRRAYGATSTQPVAREVDAQAQHCVRSRPLQHDCPAIPPLAGARFRAPPARANAGPQQKCPAGEISVLILSWRTRFPRPHYKFKLK